MFSCISFIDSKEAEARPAKRMATEGEERGNKRRLRTDDTIASTTPRLDRVLKLRLSDDLASKLVFGRRYCTEAEFVAWMISQNMCSRVWTFDIKVALVSDPSDWTSITLDDEHSSAAEVKKGVERLKGVAPATQELFLHDEINGSGGSSGGSSSGSDANLQASNFVPSDDFVFDTSCSLLVAVNETNDVILEGQESEEGDPMVPLMGVYQRLEGMIQNGKGVWQSLKMVKGSDGSKKKMMLYFAIKKNRWMVSNRSQMDAGKAKGAVCVYSLATTPDQIKEAWQVIDVSTRDWIDAPKLHARLCSSVEKQAAVLFLQQEENLAVQKARSLIAEALSGGAAAEVE
jgi:hypothetical protein